MAGRNSMPAGLVASTLHETNGELADDQVGESRGEQPGRKRTRRQPSGEKGRSRNLVIPDELYDEMHIYALRFKVTEKTKKGATYKRSLTVSEAWCKAARSLLAKNGSADADRPAATE